MLIKNTQPSNFWQNHCPVMNHYSAKLVPDLRLHLPVLEGRKEHWRKKSRLNNEPLCHPSFKSLVFIIEFSLAQKQQQQKKMAPERLAEQTTRSWSYFRTAAGSTVVITFLSVFLNWFKKMMLILKIAVRCSISDSSCPTYPTVIQLTRFPHLLCLQHSTE